MDLVFLQNAAQQYQVLLQAPVPAPGVQGLLDPVVAGYAPLQHINFYQAAQGGAAAVRSCAESALICAQNLRWADENADRQPAQRAPLPNPMAANAPNGLTAQQMTRRISHIAGMVDFPVQMYDEATDTFALIHGKERKDGWAIVFLPTTPLLPVAHWTFGVVPRRVIYERPHPTPDVLVYTRLPLMGSRPGQVYWRAEVTPENHADYVDMKTQGSACDCDWNLRCVHEEQWLAQHPAAHRVTLNDGQLVAGTMMAQVVSGIDPMRKVTKGTNGTICVASRGRKNLVVNAHNSETLRRAGVNFQFWRQRQYVDVIPFLTIDVRPLKLQLYQVDEDDVMPLGWLLPSTILGYQRVAKADPVQPDIEWGYHEDLCLDFPFERQLMAQMACATDLTPADIRDRLRRKAAEHKFEITVDRRELELFIERTRTDVGKMVYSPPTGHCRTCHQKGKLHHQECKKCRKIRERLLPESLVGIDAFATSTGFVGLWSKSFTLPQFNMKQNSKLEYRGRAVTKDQAVAICRRYEGPISCRGRSVGPIFLGQTPTCFKRGPYTAALAFLVRLGADREHQAQARWYDVLYTVACQYIDEWAVEPEGDELFLSHFSGDKLKKMLEARTAINEGHFAERKWMEMNGFPKAEKSYSSSLDYDVPIQKATEKPRFICSPDPMVLYKLGRYTHAQTKWLASQFPWTRRIFYAGCATPTELTGWLRKTLDDIPEPWSVVDDITAIDANHNQQSFDFHERVRFRQFGSLPDMIARLFRSEEKVRVRLDFFVLIALYVNASGVSDTSYKNSLLCLLIRIIACLHALCDLTTLTQAGMLIKLRAMTSQIWTTASGDDGLTRLPDRLLGVHMTDFSCTRYREAWSWFGFGVKVCLVPPNRWRMATYLAMRPVWTTDGYEWAPEPARRMRGMFWQIDNAMHPIAYGRGIAAQVREQAHALPVLGEVVQWYLETTSGPTAETVHATNPYSPFHGAVLKGTRTERTVDEFCMDYRVTRAELKEFSDMLRQVHDPLVNLCHHVLVRIYAEES